MKTKDYFKGKSRIVLTAIFTIGLLSCSSGRTFNSENEAVKTKPETDYENYFKTKGELISYIDYDDLYFTDFNTYKSNYFSGKVLFGQYENTGLGNRFDNIIIDNHGINIFSDKRPLELGRVNWSYNMNQLESWGWINKGWNTPWNQKGWRSISNSWNGPIWNYWGYVGDARIFRLMESNQIYARNSYERSSQNKSSRLSVYHRTYNNIVQTPRTTPRSRPKTKTKISTINTYNSNSITRSNSTNNSRSTIQRSNSSNNRTVTRGTSSALSSSNSSGKRNVRGRS